MCCAVIDLNDPIKFWNPIFDGFWGQKIRPKIRIYDALYENQYAVLINEY